MPLERIKVVRSHPAALDQCRRLLATMPWATAIAAGSTAEAAAEVAERGDPEEAAIAGERAAAVYGLSVIAEDVGDHAETYTRFVSVATHTRLDSAGQDWRTAFSFVTDHRPGALHHAIAPFSLHGIDLVQLVSRPIPDTPWRYCFHAVLAGHPLDPPIRAALAEIAGADAPPEGVRLLSRARRRRLSVPSTLFERVWDAHVVREEPDGPALLYVDLHLIHEVTSPQAFEGLRLAGRGVRRADRSLATMDHNVPTVDGPVTDPLARAQLDALRRNCEEFGVPLYATGSGREGIVHVIGPELGVTQPGMTIVCGDSHTSTHGAFGALAFGIGTSEVEHVLATQTLPQRRPRTMRVRFDGVLPLGVTAKDAILGAIGQIGVAGEPGT